MVAHLVAAQAGRRQDVGGQVEGGGVEILVDDDAAQREGRVRLDGQRVDGDVLDAGGHHALQVEGQVLASDGRHDVHVHPHAAGDGLIDRRQTLGAVVQPAEEREHVVLRGLQADRKARDAQAREELEALLVEGERVGLQRRLGPRRAAEGL
jgi:hypothetical protein